jgi:hypothetical protein
LHGRNRAFLVRTRKFSQPVRESTPAADPTLVRVPVARPRGYPAHGGVARRCRQERRGINHSLVRASRRVEFGVRAATTLWASSDDRALDHPARRHSGVGDGFGDRMYSAVGRWPALAKATGGLSAHIPFRGDGDDRYRPCVLEMLAARRKKCIASSERNGRPTLASRFALRSL